MEKIFSAVLACFPSFGQRRDRLHCFGIVFDEAFKKRRVNSGIRLAIGNRRVERLGFAARDVPHYVVFRRYGKTKISTGRLCGATRNEQTTQQTKDKQLVNRNTELCHGSKSSKLVRRLFLRWQIGENNRRTHSKASTLYPLNSRIIGFRSGISRLVRRTFWLPIVIDPDVLK